MATRKKPLNNTQLVKHLMQSNTFGSLAEIFVVQAVHDYAEKILDQKAELLAKDADDRAKGRHPLVSVPAWIDLAEEIKTKIENR